MNSLLKLIGGITIGAAIGAGVYLIMTNEDNEGIVHNLKTLVNDAVAEGKLAAEFRRTELQIELGQIPEDSNEQASE